MRILLVEDTESHALPLERYLTNAGHEVEMASSKDRAFLMLDTKNYDVAAVDLVLNVSTGDTVAERAALKGLGVVLMSAASEQQLQDVRTTLELKGCIISSVLTKGFPPRMLLVALELAYKEAQERKRLMQEQKVAREE